MCFSMLLSLIVILASWVGGGTPTPPQMETIYAGVSSMSAHLPGTPIVSLSSFESHINYYKYEIGTCLWFQYETGRSPWLEFGVTSTNCADGWHLQEVRDISAGHSAIGFRHNVLYSGEIWFQYISQCEEDYDGDSANGVGAYFKGVQWYAAGDYPVAPTDNIMLDMGFNPVSCPMPPQGGKYGCGSGDLN